MEQEIITAMETEVKNLEKQYNKTKSALISMRKDLYMKRKAVNLFIYGDTNRNKKKQQDKQEKQSQ